MTEFLTFAFETLGCKLNFAESSALAKDLMRAGFTRVDLDQSPQVLVVNTCSVTEDADGKCRNIIRRALRQNPNTYVAVIGCYAQLKPEAIAAIPGVKLVLGANEKFNLAEAVIAERNNEKPVVKRGAIKDVNEFHPSFSSGDRTRTFLKVQDGCNYFCSFCTIPLARGRSRSATIHSTLLEAEKAIASGAKEIVLTGVNIGDFGTQNNESLMELIVILSERFPHIRFRISSIEPNLLSEDIIDFVSASQNFMPHFHIPLQSGDDDILQKMRRRYRRSEYEAKVKSIIKKLPEAAIGIDVITGFPGESDAHFQNTLNFLSELPLTYLHVFTYSERPNTTALRIPDVVPVKLRQQRTMQLRLLSEKKKSAFYRSMIGKSAEVLWEEEESDGYIYGYTPNYVRVKSVAGLAERNTISRVNLSELLADGTVLA
jgi:threonylcarbamoyladenosine tRNA methylthiotransferase MtaB